MNTPRNYDTLIWEDQFDGPTLDYSRWECEVNAFGGGNKELQLYTDYPRNVRVEDGKLVLEAHREDVVVQGTRRSWSSGRVRSKHRGDWTYGRFEASIKLPKGRGFWPAFWMLPTDEEFGGWPRSGEIDIMEHDGQRSNEVIAAAHYGPPWPHNRHTAKKPSAVSSPGGPDFSEGFHTFGLVWNQDRLTWFVDGEEAFGLSLEEIQKDGGNPEAFRRRFHLIFNIAVGGDLPGLAPPDASTPSSARMEVDWVRVYQ